MKNRGMAVLMCAALMFAAVAYSQDLATDKDGKNVINHSNGVLVFKYGQLQNAKSITNPDGGAALNKYVKTLNFYTTSYAYPTTFVPESIAYDAGCHKHTLTESAVVSRPSDAGGALYCIIDVPLAALDAGVYTIYKADDGGYGVSQCPSNAVLPTDAWSAFCNVQRGYTP